MISYIVITYNRCGITRKCIQSLLGVMDDIDEIIVVDNGSTDRTRDMLTEFQDRVVLILSDENLGVTGGRNLGVKHARGEILVFLDDDARFLSTGISAKIRTHLLDRPAIAGLAFTILDEETGAEQYQSIPGTKTSKWQKPTPCAYFCGAGFAVRKSTFQQIGFFWDLLFYAGEELEFGYRAVSNDQYFLFVDDIVVLHASTPVARPSGQFFYYQARNRPLIALRHLPLRFCFTQTVAWWIFLAAKSIWSGRFLYFCKGIRDCIRLVPEAWDLRGRVNLTVIRSLARLRGRLLY